MIFYEKDSALLDIVVTYSKFQYYNRIISFLVNKLGFL